MELNLFKHHYFVIVSFRLIEEKKAYTFIHCRAKDILKNVLQKIPEHANKVGIESVTKLD